MGHIKEFDRMPIFPSAGAIHLAYHGTRSLPACQLTHALSLFMEVPLCPGGRCRLLKTSTTQWADSQSAREEPTVCEWNVSSTNSRLTPTERSAINCAVKRRKEQAKSTLSLWFGSNILSLFCDNIFFLIFLRGIMNNTGEGLSLVFTKVSEIIHLIFFMTIHVWSFTVNH